MGGMGALIALPTFSAHRGGAGTLPIWRATGQNMRQTVQGFVGGANWSSCYRSRHYSTVPFRYARFVMPTFYQTGGQPIADIDFPTSYNFQLGIEYPFVNAFSGIPTRITATFGGANSASYVSGVGPFGYILSDVVDFGSIVPAGVFFGMWTTVENAAGAGSAANSLPYQANTSNNYQAGWQRYTGAAGASSSLISAGTALTASSITGVGSAQNGAAANAFSPCMMLIQCDAHYRSIFTVGDCIAYGNSEGQAGSLTYGDVMGSALGNAGFLARYVFEQLNYNMVNFGRGGDSFGYYSALNWQYRLKMLTLANPTHIICQYGHNDLSGGATVATVLANAQACFAGMRAAAPGVPIIQVTQSPSSTSTDNWTTTANQTASTFFGNSASRRGTFNDTYIRTNGSALGNDGFLDINPSLEFGYIEGNAGSETSLWNVTGAANGLCQDGVHPNSNGHLQAATGMIASRNGSIVTDPFT